MSHISTPISSSSSTSKKRFLSSPEDASELKKNKVLAGTELTEEDTSDISDLSDTTEIMDTATGGASATTHITLADNDLKKIAFYGHLSWSTLSVYVSHLMYIQ